jgi:hypothetical protein
MPIHININIYATTLKNPPPKQVPDEEEEGQVAEEGVVHTKKEFKPRGTGPAMDDPDADRFDPILNGGRGGGGGGRLASRLGPAAAAARGGGGGGVGKGKGEEELKAEERGEVPEVSKRLCVMIAGLGG